jgi:hypothetical protein
MWRVQEDSKNMMAWGVRVCEEDIVIKQWKVRINGFKLAVFFARSESYKRY